MRRTEAQFVDRCLRERKIEEHQTQSAPGNGLPHDDVVRFNIPMRNSLMFQVIHCFEQVLAETLQKVYREPPLTP